ncbi:hypothetical protein COB57_04055 [Candidatus Peregrinibacteria bacterium]|nr:MAG: hypothetical protein COB57_04055 [Candidatus Peregrinibacteria bacterium]
MADYRSTVFLAIFKKFPRITIGILSFLLVFGSVAYYQLEIKKIDISLSANLLAQGNISQDDFLQMFQQMQKEYEEKLSQERDSMEERFQLQLENLLKKNKKQPGLVKKIQKLQKVQAAEVQVLQQNMEKLFLEDQKTLVGHLPETEAKVSFQASIEQYEEAIENQESSAEFVEQDSFVEVEEVAPASPAMAKEAPEEAGGEETSEEGEEPDFIAPAAEMTQKQAPSILQMSLEEFFQQEPEVFIRPDFVEDENIQRPIPDEENFHPVLEKDFLEEQRRQGEEERFEQEEMLRKHEEEERMTQEEEGRQQEEDQKRKEAIEVPENTMYPKIDIEPQKEIPTNIFIKPNNIWK